MSDHSLWLYETVYLEHDEGPASLITDQPFRSLSERWAESLGF